jgi:hypothetical protein
VNGNHRGRIGGFGVKFGLKITAPAIIKTLNQQMVAKQIYLPVFICFTVYFEFGFFVLHFQ